MNKIQKIILSAVLILSAIIPFIPQEVDSDKVFTRIAIVWVIGGILIVLSNRKSGGDGNANE